MTEEHSSFAYSATGSTSHGGPVSAFLPQLLARRNAICDDPDKAFIARKGRILNLKSSVSAAPSLEAMVCPHVAILQTSLSDARVELSAAHFSATLAATEWD